ADFDAIMKTVAELTAHRTDGIAAWMKTAAEPVLREYAARFLGQGDRFHNIRDLDRLRVEVARVTLEDVQAKISAAQEPAPPPPLTLEDVIAAVKSIAVVKVVKFDARAAVPVADAVSGRWYLVRGCIAMASPQRDEKQRTFILEHGTPLGVGYLKDDVTPLLATPCDVVDGASKNTPPEAQPPQTDENGNVITTQGMEPSLPRKVGEAAKPTGVVPVWFLGHHKRAKKALEFFQSLSSQGDAFGVALCGKTPETEKLKAFTFTGYDTGAPVPVETAAKTVGSAVWDHFGTLVKGL
ncbi:MAG: hypothetical protein WC565_07715, partial [Parcubacteria group bacterium]